ncbi:MAG: CHAT domain-containing protein [Prevotella sp.]|nr:CHAT domain-containing protein [Prevotella sp.]
MFAQEVFDESAMKEVQALIINKEHNKVDSILEYYQKYPQGEDASFAIDLTRCFNGYVKIQTIQDVSAIIPYAESGKRAFTYIKNNINEGNASQSDLWPILTMCAELFNSMNDSIIDEIEKFSSKYYSDYGQKNLYSYYTVVQNTYQHHFSRREWQAAIDVMENYNKIAIEAGDSTMRIPISSAFIGAAFLRKKNTKEALTWFTDSYNRFINYDERIKFRAYCELLSDIAYAYFLERNDDLAYKFAVLSCEANISTFGEDSKEYLNALDILNNCEIRLDRKQESEKHIEEFLLILDNRLNMELKEKQIYITEKATNSANDKKSIILFEYLLSCFNKNVDVDRDFFAFVASSLSNLYISKGFYHTADSILNGSLDLFNEKEVMSNEIVSLYHSKGLLYLSLNNYDMALQWLMKAKKYYDNVCFKDIEYAKLLSNLSMCYFEKDDFSLAKSYADEACTLYADSYGANFEKASGTLLLLNNLALIYSCSKEYDKAKTLYNRVIDVSSKTHDKEMKSLAQLGMAQLLFLEGDYGNANMTLSEIKVNELRTRERVFFEFFSSLLSCLQTNGNIDSLVNKYDALQQTIIIDVFDNFSAAEREGYWTYYSRSLVLLNNLAAIKSGTPQAIVMAYENALFTKSMLINSSKLLDIIVKGYDNQYIKDTYSSMINMKRRLSGKNCPNDSVDIYREVISEKEKTLVAAIPNFGSRLMAQFKTCGDVQKMLSDNDIAIEFIFLPQIKTPFDESELLYGAMLLAKGDIVPKLIPLCSEYDLKDLMDAYTPMGQNEIDSLYAFSNKTLYQMIWEKIEPYIPVGSTVYYSPTGYIGKINLSAISNGNNRLEEVYNFYEVSTTALIDEVKQGIGIDYHNAALYGDVNYYEDVDLMAEKARAYSSYTSGEILATRSLNRGTWDLLPGTKEEVGTIAEMLRGKGLNVYMLTQNDANEESFKAFDAHAPALIHIATHGFYFPPEVDVTSSFFNGLHSYTQKDYSMLFSGLLFAGGNNAWTGKEIEEGVEDGILTADEISRLDLSANKLIVLSACNTGLGDIDIVDGVFGLQRGLKRAGVKTILMSLWKVPDKETKELMRLFYKELLSGKTPHQSLKTAQNQLMTRGNSPYYWAGFILLD